jgi:aryl-alcohol dehydrogenase-like predicted oxidoreductase
VARALKEIPSRQRPYVFTKCSLAWDDLGNVSHSLNPASIRREAEASLRRLDIDCIDLYEIGWPACSNCDCLHGSASLEQAWTALTALQREGKVRYIGVSDCPVDRLTELLRSAPVTSLHVPYSLLRREVEKRTLPFCASHRIGVVACSPLESGLLTGSMTLERAASLPHNDWRRRSTACRQLLSGEVPRLIERLQAVAARHRRSPGEIAIAWTLRHPAVAAAAVGARRPNQVDEIVGAASFRLTADEIDEIEQAPSVQPAAIPQPFRPSAAVK